MKKSEYISFRTSQTSKAALEKYAAEKKWSISFLVEEIIQEWIEKHTHEEAPEK